MEDEEGEKRSGGARVARTIDVDAAPERVFELWCRFETFPEIMESVRRVKQIDARHILWDAEVAGRQFVGEALLEECVPGKIVRWRSIRGSRHAGEARFDPQPGGGTRLSLALHVRPRRWLDRLGVRLGALGWALGEELERFRRHVEGVRGLRGGGQGREDG